MVTLIQARVKSYDSQWLVATQRTCLLYTVILQVHCRCGKKPIDCTCVVADWLITCILKTKDITRGLASSRLLVQTPLKPLRNAFKLAPSQDVTEDDKNNTGRYYQQPAPVAEWLTHGPRKQQVAGSHPAEATSEQY